MSKTVNHNSDTLVNIGTVGIGTTNPSYALDVTGQIRPSLGLIVPAFRVNMGTGAAQSVAAGTTAIAAFNTVETDTNSWFTNTAGNYKFTPQLAGYYQINWQIVVSYLTTPPVETYGGLYLNGSLYVWGTDMPTWGNFNFTSTHYLTTGGSAIIYLNGSTDSINIQISSVTQLTTLNPNGTTYPCRFSGVLVRGA